MERKRIYIISHYNPDTNARYIDGAALTEEQAVILADRATPQQERITPRTGK